VAVISDEEGEDKKPRLDLRKIRELEEEESERERREITVS